VHLKVENCSDDLSYLGSDITELIPDGLFLSNGNYDPQTRAKKLHQTLTIINTSDTLQMA